MKHFVTYLVTYKGDKIPPYYIGSTSESKILSGKYFGSPKSKKWKNLFNTELKNNLHLFSVEILKYYTDRKSALIGELEEQINRNVVKSSDYFNESYATVNGFFGHDVSNENNPMFGKSVKAVLICKYGEVEGLKKWDYSNKLKKENGKNKGVKPILQFQENILIKEFKSITEASKLTNINFSLIARSCYSNCRAGGFIWTFKNESDKFKQKHKKTHHLKNKPSKNRKQVVQLYLDGTIFKKYDSLTEASNAAGFSKSVISKACNNKQKAVGFLWKYNI